MATVTFFDALIENSVGHINNWPHTDEVDATFLALGENYIVVMTVGGRTIEYECVCQETEWYGIKVLYIGSPAMLSMDDTGEDFLLAHFPEAGFSELGWRKQNYTPFNISVLEKVSAEDPTDTVSTGKKFLLQRLFGDRMVKLLCK